MEPWFKERVDKLEDQLDKIQELLSDLDKTLMLNTALLDQHVKKTNILEEELKPIKDQVRLTRQILFLLLGLVGVGGTVAGILSDLKFIK